MTATGPAMMTVIGRREDLVRFDADPNVDHWWKTGRVPGVGDPLVTWAENRLWLEVRIARSDAFGLATDPATLPPVAGGYDGSAANGYFTAREYHLLTRRGVPVEKLW